LNRAIERIRRLDPPPKLIAPQHGGLVEAGQIEPLLTRMQQLQVGVDLLERSADKAAYVNLANGLVTGLIGYLGKDDMASLLRLYSADGSFPSLFVMQGSSVVEDIKVDPRAAVRALIRDALELCDEHSGPAVRQFVHRTLDEQGMTSLLRAVD
jgi:hypothetical protein